MWYWNFWITNLLLKNVNNNFLQINDKNNGIIDYLYLYDCG